MAVLSIQSHVAYGHVGNRAAVFPLERLGHEVWPIHTVQFSNHKGYGSWTGEVFTAAHLALVWSGIKACGRLSDCEAVLSGYLGSADVGFFVLQAVEEVKASRPEALYCCDPVMGDYGKGLYVDEGVSDFIRGHAVRAADIITPNQFEAEAIAGAAISSISEAKAACDEIRGMGPSIVVITSFKPELKAKDSISLFLASDEGFHVLSTPELSIDPPMSGAGDLTAALFLAHYLEMRDPVEALELTVDSVFSVFERSFAEGSKELSLVQAQEEIAHPGRRFAALKV
jgi:pyridoxine kinase